MLWTSSGLKPACAGAAGCAAFASGAEGAGDAEATAFASGLKQGSPLGDSTENLEGMYKTQQYMLIRSDYKTFFQLGDFLPTRGPSSD